MAARAAAAAPAWPQSRQWQAGRREGAFSAWKSKVPDKTLTAYVLARRVPMNRMEREVVVVGAGEWRRDVGRGGGGRHKRKAH